MLSEGWLEEYGNTTSQDSLDLAKLGNPMSTRKERSVDGYHKQDQKSGRGGPLVTLPGGELTSLTVDDTSNTKWESVHLKKDWAHGIEIPWWRSLNETLDKV